MKPVSRSWVLPVFLAVALLLGALTVGVLNQTADAQVIGVGSQVKTTANLGVRATPFLSSPLLGRQATGRQGTILEGPVSANGYTWWRVDYVAAPDGWSAGAYLVLVSGGPISTAPTITVQPQSQTVTAGQTAAFSVSAQGTQPLSYQWQKGSVNVGTNGATLTISNAQQSDAGTYTVTISNVEGSVTSNPATLTMNPAGGGGVIGVGSQVKTTVNLGVRSSPSLSSPLLGRQSAGNHGVVVGGPTAADGYTWWRVDYVAAPDGWSAGEYLVAVGAVPTVTPVITTQPANQTVAVGEPAAFTCAASGNPTPTYQWQKGSVNIAGAVSASYTTPATTIADSGAQFRCVATNSRGSATSDQATLTVTSGASTSTIPFITAHPQNQIIDENQPATFMVSAGGGGLAYQWQVLGVGGFYADIPGATASVYTISSSTQQDDKKILRVVVRNNKGSVPSNSSRLFIRQNSGTIAPGFMSPPLDLTVALGQMASFDCYAVGSPQPLRQWQRSNASGEFRDLPGQTYQEYSLLSASSSDHGARFRCTASNFNGFAVSVIATLTVIPATSTYPSIVQNPQNQSVQAGQTATFSTVVQGVTPLAYQWQKGTPTGFMNILSYGNQPVYTTPPTTLADSGTQFRLVVRNSLGIATSSAATLTVSAVTQSAPTITVHPQPQIVSASQTAAFSVIATGTAPLSYQWKKDGVTVGTNSNTLSITNAQATDAGSYTVTVSNAAGSITSNAATLTVNPAGGGTQTPYGGTPAPIPGTIQAENFDEGGEGVAYHDVNTSNQGGQFRTTGVDIESTSDTGGGYTVGWISAGEWLEYAVNVTTAGTYTLEARVASNGPGGNFHVEVDGMDKTGAITIPSTGGWQSWQTLSRPGVTLTAGQHIVRVAMDSNGSTGWVGNLNWIRLRDPNAPEPPMITTQPQSQSAYVGDTVTFSVTAQGTPAPSYQWKKDSGNVGTNSNTLTITNAQATNAGSYTVTVSNGGGSITSNPASLTVSSGAPAITTHPVNQTAPVGLTATFSVTATGRMPLAYQWQKNGGDIFGATGTTYTTPPIVQGDNGVQYRVRVTNTPGPTVVSNAATLTVGVVASGVRGRVRIVNNTVVADNGSLLRGDHLLMTSWNTGRINDINWYKNMSRKYRFNAVRLLAYRPPMNVSGGCTNRCVTLNEVLPLLDTAVANAKATGLYAIIDYHPLGGWDETEADPIAWWTVVAARYKNEPHVIYEITNEPTGTGYAHPRLPAYEQRMYALIRGLAPNTHIILWSVPDLNSPNRDQMINTGGIDYSNASAGFHIYGTQFGLVSGLRQARPIFMTEAQECNATDAECRANPEGTASGYISAAQRYENSGYSWILLKGINVADCQFNYLDYWIGLPGGCGTPTPQLSRALPWPLDPYFVANPQ
ncbi:MAG: immunoglobulin domain-containing protein [bacterium]|nr:immunoglobulin domain-containing protein [bacterium]